MLELFLKLWYIWVIFAIIILYRVFKPIIHGFIGEKVLSVLLLTLPAEKYILIDDVILKTEIGTTQIDHIIVSVYGVFVIETKNYKGFILGKENDDFWIQNIYGHKHQFKNPIHQNYGHIMAIKAILSDYEKMKLISIIAFSGRCTLRIKTSKNVVYYGQVKGVIQAETEELFTQQQIHNIALKISSSNINNRENKKEHVAKVKNSINNYNEAINNNICPKCGGKLISRKGKYGKFFGCSNYPKCKFTLKDNIS